jgi:hypothetical protein
MGVAIPLMGAGLFYLTWHFDRERGAFNFIFIPVLMVWLVYRQFRDQLRNWQKYPTVELAPNEVTAILESPRGIIVETNERLKKLFISRNVSDYEGLRSRLLSWAPTLP